LKFRIPPRASKVNITGERYTPQWAGRTELEHFHRYLFAAKYCTQKKVLDIASGEGYGCFLLSQAATEVFGVDVDAQTVQLAEQKYRRSNLSFRVGECEHIPFEDDSFDVVVSFETLEHIGEKQQIQFLKEIKRVLKPQGLLVMSSPEKEVYSLNCPDNPYHAHEINRDEFKSLISEQFQYHKPLSQNFFIGSLIQDETSSKLIFFEEDDRDNISCRDKLQRLEYLIYLASDQELPLSNSGLYLDSYFDSARKAHIPRPNGYWGISEQAIQLRQQNESLQQQHKTLKQQYEPLKQQYETLQHQIEAVQEENRNILASRSWRYTKPLRLIVALVRRDKRYLYNVGQQVRTQVWMFRQASKVKRPRLSRFITEPFFRFTKKVFKPILRSTLYRFIARSGNDLYQSTLNVPYESSFEDNQDFSQYTTDIKAIAFYLPQFHQIPENDKWWGEGFTEWTNTKKAKPLFEGHYQPREPHGDIGYYDLSDIEVLKKQAALARQHGIYGFCFYHYYFHGKRLLEKPVDMLLERPEIDINFCLCWANESWTKKWDGAEDDILIAQEHSEEDDINFIKDLIRYLKDPRYIKSDGKPVVLIYRPLLLPDPKATFARWRDYCRRNGIGEIAIWAVRGCFYQETGMGLEDAVEAEVEFPAHLTASHEWMSPALLKRCRLKAPIANYKALVKSAIAGDTVTDTLLHPIYRMAVLGWDNTARRNEMGHVFYGFSTHLYYKWLRHIMESTRRRFSPEDRFVFINAWNEWAEGAYLEPDEKYGYASINTTARALYDLPYHLKNNDKKGNKREHEALFLGELSADQDNANNLGTVAVHAHIFHTDLTHELVYYMNNIPVNFDCYITTDTEAKKKEIANKVKHRLHARNVDIRVTPNIGRDVAPFLVGCRDVVNAYDYICHIHTKKSAHIAWGDHWRNHLMEYLLGSKRLVAGVLNHFHRNPKIGMIYPPFFSAVKSMAVWGDNHDRVKELVKKIGADIELPEKPVFPGGTMMWLRTKAFEDVFNAGLTYEDFDEETGQLDGTLAHAFERLLVYIVDHNGFYSRSIAGE
jgi:lipopolysaccharide biosynthesis protein/SAM-dependent methyltransferase